MSDHLTVEIVPLGNSSGIPVPHYQTEHSAGVDLYAAVDGDLVIGPGKWKLVPTGIAVAIPEGYEGQVRPRSGLALKHGIGMLNSPGTIDADYRGEIGVILINHGEEPFSVNPGDRIAQMVVHRVSRVTWVVCSDLAETSRGDGGFGHTDRYP